MKATIVIGADSARSLSLCVKNLAVPGQQHIIAATAGYNLPSLNYVTASMRFKLDLQILAKDFVASALDDGVPYYRRFNKSRY